MQTELNFTHIHENNATSQAFVNEHRQHFNTQCQRVYTLLRQGHRLTVMSAMNDYGIMSLPRRCADLREKGILIKSEFIKGQKVKEYYL